MKSRKVGANQKHKRNATKRKRASNIRKSKKKMLNKRKRRTRKSTRRQRGGNADYVVVVLESHGECHIFNEKELEVAEAPEGMNIRKINGARIGNSYFTATKEWKEEVASIVTNTMNNNGNDNNLTDVATALAHELKSKDIKESYEEVQGQTIAHRNLVNNQVNNVNSQQDHFNYDSKFDDHDPELKVELEKEKMKLEEYRDDQNRSKIQNRDLDRSYQIEIINDNQPDYFQKSLSLEGNHSIELFEYGKAPVNINKLGRMQLRTSRHFYLSDIFSFLHKEGKNNVILIDMSCSHFYDDDKTFDYRSSRANEREKVKEGKILHNPSTEDWIKNRNKKRKLEN
tara:strand:- start:86 stop:1111 length:1026 start_codon:yes stop_codon:yes gene_type:complete